MQSVDIRAVTPQDLPAVLDMVRELAVFEHLEHLLVATEADFHAALFGPKPVAEALIARCEGQAVGYAIFFHTFSTFLGRAGLYLEDLYVRRDTRRQGVGTALLGRVADIARQRGCGRLEWTALDWNEPAIRMYRKFGAQMLEEWKLFRITF